MTVLFLAFLGPNELSVIERCLYSLTYPYGHLYNTDTSVKRTLGSVPLVSLLNLTVV